MVRSLGTSSYYCSIVCSVWSGIMIPINFLDFYSWRDVFSIRML